MSRARPRSAARTPSRSMSISPTASTPIASGRRRRAAALAPPPAPGPPAMGRHLRTLRQSGLTEESHPAFDARVRIYSLRPEPMASLTLWLEETEKLWSAQLLAFKAHLEGDE